MIGGWRRWLVVAAAIAVLVTAAHGASGWYYASVLDNRALDAGAKRARLVEIEYRDSVVVSVTEGSISLSIAGSQGRETREGTWGVAWPAGYGLIKEILSVDGETVTRRFVHQDGPLPAAGTRVDLDRKAISPGGGEYLAGAEVVAVPGPLGTYPSRYLPGWRDTWVLMVNGNSLDWRDLGALAGPLHDAGYPVLIVTLRNYPGAPESSGGRLTYGVDEWADLDAAVGFALDAGARNVVLVAASMGAGVVMSFFTHSLQTAAVAAVFFDAPMLSFRRAVDFQASQFKLPLVRLGLPGTVTATARWIASLRYGVDWGATDYLDDGGRVTAPVLIVHGDDDEDVPLATSREFARRYPNTVRLVVVEGARHLEAWNVDPAAYETLLLQFLEANLD